MELKVCFSAGGTHFHSGLVPEGSSALHPQPARAQGLWRGGKVDFHQLLPIAPSTGLGGLFWCRTALLSEEKNGMQANAEQPR